MQAPCRLWILCRIKKLLEDLLRAVMGVVQDAKKTMDELEVLKGTLQPKSGIHMICKQR